MYKGLGLITQGEAQWFWKGFEKRGGAYTYMDAQKFLRYEKGYGTYTHMEAQKFLKRR